MQTVELPLIPVHIQRARDELHVEVPEHEIAVLRAVHGNVRKVPAKEYVLETFDANANAELGRLARKYATAGGANPVGLVYRAAHELVSFGFSEVVEEVGEAPQSFNEDNRKKIRATKVTQPQQQQAAS